MSNPEPSSTSNKELNLVIYGKTAENILEMQRRQWNVVYYALLLMASVVGVYLNYPIQLTPGSAWALELVLHLIVISVVGASVYFLLNLQWAITKARNLMISTWSRLCCSEVTPKPFEDNYGSFFRQWGVFCLFIFSICAGWELAEWVFLEGAGVYFPAVLLFASFAPFIPAVSTRAELAIKAKMEKPTGV